MEQTSRSIAGEVDDDGILNGNGHFASFQQILQSHLKEYQQLVMGLVRNAKQPSVHEANEVSEIERKTNIKKEQLLLLMKEGLFLLSPYLFFSC